VIIYHDGITHVMTLLIGVRNHSDFVVGCDSLVKHISHDGKVTYSKGQKLFPLGARTALMVSGAYESDMCQFVRDFAFNNQNETDLETLGRSLINHPTLPKPTKGHNMKFTLVGFIRDEPCRVSVGIEYGKEPQLEQSQGTHFSVGFDGPRVRAMELMNEAINKHKGEFKLTDLRKIVKSTLLKSIREYKNSADERLGGPPVIHVL